MASPDAPQTTSALVPVRGIDRQVLDETRLRLDTSQPIPRKRGRPACQQPPDRTRNRLLRSPGARLDRRDINSLVTFARQRSLVQPPCATTLRLAHRPGARLYPCSTNTRGFLARQHHPARPPCDTKAPPERNPGTHLGRCRTNTRGRLAPRHRPAQPPCDTKT